ncbi:MAG: hypothetical protein V7693_16210 [Halopseudomonas sabulinigri]
MSQNRNYLEEFALTVRQIGDNVSLPAFWEKNSQEWGVSPAVQAGIVGLYRDGRLSCSGKPGSMTFYTTGSSNPVARMFSKVTTYRQVFFTALFMVVLMQVLLSQSAWITDVIALCLACIGLVGYFSKVSQSYYSGVLSACVPGRGSRLSYLGVLGIYNAGWFSAGGYIYLLIKRLAESEYVSAGGVGPLYSVVEDVIVEMQGVFSNLATKDAIDLITALGIVAISYWVVKLGAALTGVFFSGLGFEGSYSTLARHNLYNKYLDRSEIVNSKGFASLFVVGLLVCTFLMGSQIQSYL